MRGGDGNEKLHLRKTLVGKDWELLNGSEKHVVFNVSYCIMTSAECYFIIVMALHVA